MIIKILGTGCAKCEKLERAAREALSELSVEAEVEKVKDLDAIMAYGVMMTPGLVINEKVKSAGKIPSIDQIKNWIQESNEN
ncbi:MAG: thioredoxin family protein [candidate division KSB1 bacterium]|nr:thioredoxin family protein [candidate division KSB1 bacterium]